MVCQIVMLKLIYLWITIPLNLFSSLFFIESGKYSFPSLNMLTDILLGAKKEIMFNKSSEAWLDIVFIDIFHVFAIMLCYSFGFGKSNKRNLYSLYDGKEFRTFVEICHKKW